MKRTVVLLIGVVTSFYSVAQVAIGVQGTGNWSDAHLKLEDVYTKNTRVFPGAGIVADIAVSPSLTVRTGLNYQQQGITLKSTVPGVGDMPVDEIAMKGTLNLNYVQVPLNVLFTTRGRIQFFAGGGPYASFAVNGKSKLEATYKFSDGSVETEKQESNVFEKDENGETAFKRFDYGIGVIAGIKLPGNLFASVGYQYSLANISKTDGEQYKNRGLQLSIGYYLFRR